MDEIEKRLRETTDACIKSFEDWVKQGKNLETRETLMEAMHEIRKVISRLEVEIAISERDRLGSRPLPIPPHRSSRKPQGEDVDFGDDDMQDMNAQQPPRNQGGGGGSQGGEPRRSGGGGQNRGRRPMGLRSGGNNGNGNEGGGNNNTDGQPQ